MTNKDVTELVNSDEFKNLFGLCYEKICELDEMLRPNEQKNLTHHQAMRLALMLLKDTIFVIE